MIRDILNTQFEDVADIQYDALRGDLLQRIFIDNLSVTLRDSSNIRCAYLQVNYSLFSTVSSNINIRSLFLDSLRIHLRESQKSEPSEKSGQKTFQSYFDGLPNLRIGHLEMNNAVVISDMPPFSLDSLTLTLEVKIQNNQVTLNIEEFSGKWIEKNKWVKNISFELNGKPDKLTVNKLNVILPFSHLSAHGEITYADSLWGILSIDESYISIEEVNSLIHLPEVDSGYIALSTKLMGSLNHFSGTANLQAEVDHYHVDALLLTGGYHEGKIVIENGALTRDRGSVLFSGAYFNRGGALYAEVSKLNLEKVIEGMIPTSLNGTIQINLTDISNGNGHISLYHSIIDSILIDTLTVVVQENQDTLIFEESTSLKFGEKSKITLTGTVFKQQYLDLNVYTENTQLTILNRFFKVPDIDGLLDANLFLTGLLGDPNMRGFIWFPHMEYQDVSIDSLILQLQLDNIFSHRKGNAYFSMNRCNYKKIKLMEVMMNVTFDSNLVQIDTLVFSNNKNYAATTGYIEFNQDMVDLVLDFFRVYYEGYWLENNSLIHCQFSPEEYLLEQARFKAPDNTAMEIRGFYEPKAANLQLGIDLTHVPLEPFNQFIKDKKLNIDGRLTGDLIVLINPENVSIDGTIRGSEIAVNAVPFGDIESQFALDEGYLSLRKFEMKKENSSLLFNGILGLQLSDSGVSSEENDFHLAFKNFNLSTYLPLVSAKSNLKGNVTGTMHLSGPLNAPKGKLSMQFEDIMYSKFSSKQLTVDLTIVTDTLYIDEIKGEINETDFIAHGLYMIPLNLLEPDTLFMERFLDITIKCEDNQLDFIGLVSDQVEYLRGPFRSEFHIQGPLFNPLVKEGFFELRDGTLELSRIQDPVTNVEIDARIENGIVKLNRFSGYSEGDKDFAEKIFGYLKRLYRMVTGRFKPEGIFNCSGTIDLKEITRPVFDLNVSTYNFYLNYFVENTRLYLSTDDLHIGGQDTILITGDLSIKPGQYVVDLAKLQKNIYLTSTTTERGSALAWNIHVTIPGNFIVSSSELDMQNNFKFEIAGELHTILEPFASTMDLTGSLDILPGKYTTYGQSFNIQNGMITFSTPNVINPDIYLFAEKMSRDYRIELTISGKMEELQQSIRVLDPNGNYLDNLSEKEKLSILSFGTTDISGGSLVGAGVDVLSTSVQTAVERGAESLTGLDKVEFGSSDDVIDHRTFQLNDGLGDVSFSLGKYLSHNLYIEYSSRLGSGSIPVPKLSWEAGNNIGLQYRIGRNWSIDSKVSQDEIGNIYRISLGWKKSF